MLNLRNNKSSVSQLTWWTVVTSGPCCSNLGRFQASNGLTATLNYVKMWESIAQTSTNNVVLASEVFSRRVLGVITQTEVKG